MRITPARASKPSISTSIWLSVCSRSSWPPPRPAPRWRPTASISSTKMIDGAAVLAWSNRSRTRLAPTPTNISTKSEPEIEKNGTPASPATARASRVLPVPGGPVEQHALRDLGADGVEAGGVLEEVLDLLELLDRLVAAGDVGEGDLGVVLGHLAGLGLAELHDPAAAALHRADEEEEGADRRAPSGRRLNSSDVQRDSCCWSTVNSMVGLGLADLVGQLVGQLLRVGDLELGAVAELALDLVRAVLERGFLDVAVVDGGPELVERELLPLLTAPQPLGRDDRAPLRRAARTRGWCGTDASRCEQATGCFRGGDCEARHASPSNTQTYGRFRYFSAKSSPYPTTNLGGIRKPT